LPNGFASTCARCGQKLPRAPSKRSPQTHPQKPTMARVQSGISRTLSRVPSRVSHPGPGAPGQSRGVNTRASGRAERHQLPQSPTRRIHAKISKIAGFSHLVTCPVPLSRDLSRPGPSVIEQKSEGRRRKRSAVFDLGLWTLDQAKRKCPDRISFGPQRVFPAWDRLARVQVG
jgi:hypothetical protein